MKLSILGQGPLAQATAHCCQQYHQIMRVPDPTSDLYWFCEDVPLMEDNEPDVEYALAHIMSHARSVPPISGLMLVSTQLPVGSTARLEKEFPALNWAYNPENIRHASAVQDFGRQDRVVVGCRQARFHDLWSEVFRPFTETFIFTDPETAEFIKGATNVWLAANIALANEFGALAAKAGANPLTVAQALRLDKRLGPKLPGGPYSGGHLEREVINLQRLSRQVNVEVPLIEAIDQSNEVKR